MWSDYLLGLGTDFLVGKMVRVRDAYYLAIVPHFHSLAFLHPRYPARPEEVGGGEWQWGTGEGLKLKLHRAVVDVMTDQINGQVLWPFLVPQSCYWVFVLSTQ